MWVPRISTVSPPKIEPKMISSRTGKKTVKPTEAGLRQNAFWSKRSWWPTRARPLMRGPFRWRARCSFGARFLGRRRGEVEVDVLERGPRHFEAVELLAALQSPRGEPVQLA